ncbi:hypothetical protein [Haloechinothrix halophila]|uniref:hypothetical protein n=1 Tax=Haloechinothrix halophila TaxID=1069073 RepID=UPI0004099942|nr:hypothetical protein [Haloechinothrix halophila]
MTDSDLPAGGDSRSWTVDELADMHAGALDDVAAAELWSRVRDNPDALAVLDELDTTRAELAGLREAPVAPMPDDVAARINAALATERERAFPSTQQQPAVAPVASWQPRGQAQPDGHVVDLARRRRAKQLGWGAGLLTAAAAIVAAVALSLPTQSTQGTPLAGDSSSQSRSADEPLSLRGDDVASGAGETIGVKDFGAFGDRAGLDACLAANDLTIDDELLGVRPATVDGQDAVLAVFTTGELARYRMLALPAGCDENNQGIIYDEVVGG